MRFTYAEAMTDARYYAPLAQAAEAAGLHVDDGGRRLIYPRESDATYPYTDTGDREFLEDKEFVETMVLVTHLAAVTRTLRFTPFVLKLPVRPPVLVAKQAGSIAYLSGNRLGLGIGLSPWPEDFVALGVPWERRGKRMDECIDIVRGLTRGGVLLLRRASSTTSPPSSRCRRRPSRCRCSSEGTRDAALRRAVLKGDGWMHAGGDGEELDRLLARLAEIRKAEGDTRDDFEVHVISLDAYDPDGVKRLEDKGVTDCIVGFRVPYINGPDTEPLEKKVRHLERYAAQVIQPEPSTRPPPARPDRRGRLRRRGPRGGGADRKPALRGQRAGPRRGLRLPRRLDPLLAADGVRLRPRAPGADQPDAPVRTPGTRQPRRHLLQRLPRPGGRRTSSPAAAARTADLSFQVMDGTYSADGAPERLAAFDDRDLDVAADGTFEWRFGPGLGLKQGQHPDRPRGVRRLERRGSRHDADPADSTPPAGRRGPLTRERVAKRFGVAAKMLTGRIRTWFAFPEWFTYKEPVNTLTVPASTPGGLASQFSSIGHYSLADDEAMVVTVPVADAPYQAHPGRQRGGTSPPTTSTTRRRSPWRSRAPTRTACCAT